MKYSTRILLPLALLLLLGPGCLKPRGFQFTGEPFTLNPDIRIDTMNGRMYGYNGRGLFCVGIIGRSVGDSVEYDTLPAGLFIMAESSDVQNIILLKPHSIRVGLVDTSFSIWGFCCNSGLAAPGEEDRLTFGRISDNPRMRQLIGLVADKDISNALPTVQLAVWDITDNNRLSRSYIDAINALPPDTTPPRQPLGPGLGLRIKAERR